MAEPMSDERLTEIRERAKRCEFVPDHPGSMFTWQDSAKDVPALLAEVDRLRAELAETRRESEQYRTSLPAETQDYWAWRKRSELIEAELDRQRRRADAAGDARRRAEREHARMVKQIEQSRTWAAEIVERAEKAEADVKALATEVDRLSDAAAVSANAARTLRSRVEAARATAAELHDPTSPDGDCVELCIGCRLERDLDGETGGRS